MKKIEFFRHSIATDDIKRSNTVLRSVFLTTGTVVDQFEKDFSHYIGRRDTVGLTSCTAALHLSLLALRIGKGDEVITTPMSFCATANAIIHSGAKPVFVDVEEETGNINADLLESAINKNTKAIMPVHLYGQMCNMKAIRKIADRYNLKIIEDAAHAIEASRDNIRVGQLAHTACFSFYATKNITSGEGGAVSTNLMKIAKLLRMMRLHGIDNTAADRYTKTYKHWDMPHLGWKYNMDNIQAALLIGQLKRIDRLWSRRNDIWMRYEDAFGDRKDILLLKSVPKSKHARHLFTILVPKRKREYMLWSLQRRGIGIAVNYRPIHLLTYYKKTFGYKANDYPVAEEIGQRTISLPLYPSLSIKEVQYVVKIVREELNK